MRFFWYPILPKLVAGATFCIIALGMAQGSDLAKSGSRGGEPQMATVLIVERDVLQTRTNAFTPIINHEALVANLSDHPIEVSIESPVPDGLYKVDQFYPAFGQDSLLAAPMYFPDKIAIAKYEILERPSVETKNARVRFIWPKVRIKPGHAAIAQYDNYFGRLSQFWSEKGLRLLDLSIAAEYKASFEVRSKEISFDLQWRLKNQGKEDIENIMLDFILPDTVHSLEGKPDTTFFNLNRLSHSEGIKSSRGMLGDGFSRPATGSILAMNTPKLKPGETSILWAKVKGEKLVEKGRIWPLVTVQCRMKGDRIWPATFLHSSTPLKTSSFYYRQCNMILPDAYLFHLEPESVKVRKAPVSP
jgi:hypothetical protein